MHVEIMEGRNVHGWIIAALLARDSWATGTSLVRMHGKPNFLRGDSETPQIMAENGHATWQKGRRVGEKTSRSF